MVQVYRAPQVEGRPRCVMLVTRDRAAASWQQQMGIERIITGVVGWAANVFQPIERVGPPVPGGPVLVVANHPNALLDPLVIFRIAGRPTRPLAKAPLFQQAFIGTLLRGLGGLPVFRPKDDPALTH